MTGTYPWNGKPIRYSPEGKIILDMSGPDGDIDVPVVRRRDSWADEPPFLCAMCDQVKPYRERAFVTVEASCCYDCMRKLPKRGWSRWHVGLPFHVNNLMDAATQFLAALRYEVENERKRQRG